jgi:hypothetical protein
VPDAELIDNDDRRAALCKTCPLYCGAVERAIAEARAEVLAAWREDRRRMPRGRRRRPITRLEDHSHE